MYRYTHSYRGDSMFSTWLYSITRNHCCNSRKKKAAEPVECAVLISDLQPDSKAHDPYSAVETKQSARRIWNLIFSALNPLEARVISMHYIREIPLSAITQQLALSNPSGAKACAVCNLLLSSRLLSRKHMLKIRRTANGEVVFTVSGRMDSESIAELERLFRSEANGCHMVLDLKDITLANQDAVNFLERCEAGSITLKNCPAYILEWIMSQKSTFAKPVRGRRSNSDKPKDWFADKVPFRFRLPTYQEVSGQGQRYELTVGR